MQGKNAMKGKNKSVRAASDFIYHRELWAIKYKFPMEKEVIMQQLSLDKFLSVVTWGVNNPGVVAQVIEGLEMDIFET